MPDLLLRSVKKVRLGAPYNLKQHRMKLSVDCYIAIFAAPLSGAAVGLMQFDAEVAVAHCLQAGEVFVADGVQQFARVRFQVVGGKGGRVNGDE